MKPTLIFTTAALMTAGIISFVQFSTSDSSKQNPMQVTEATQNQPSVNALAAPGTTAPTNGAEKKAEPVAENKPAASETAPPTGNTVNNQTKDATTDTVKTMTQATPASTPASTPTPAK
jgi:hypothetical protein